MSVRYAASFLIARVVAVLTLHAFVLWWLLPKTVPLVALSLMLGLSLIAAAVAFWESRGMRADALTLLSVLSDQSGREPISDVTAQAVRASQAVRVLENAAEPQTEELYAPLTALRRFAQRARRLEETDALARAEIDEALQLGTSFLASMGHDLRGPLNSIIGFADLLVMESHGGVRESQKPSVDIIRCAAQDLLALLEQLIAWARLQAAPLILNRVPIELAEVIEQARLEAERRAASRGFVLEVGPLPKMDLYGDRKQLTVALLGLFDLSLRSGKTATLELTAEIERAGELAQERLAICLRDRGLRVRDADQEAFFEAFRPSFAPSGQRLAGLGVGPALARALVRAHGGDVWLSSRADTGTTFSVVLPLSNA